jgi:hypothetical protein
MACNLCHGGLVGGSFTRRAFTRARSCAYAMKSLRICSYCFTIAPHSLFKFGGSSCEATYGTFILW